MQAFQYLWQTFTVITMNYITMGLYNKVVHPRDLGPRPPADGKFNPMNFLKDAAISSAVPLIASKPAIIIKPAKRLLNFGHNMVKPDIIPQNNLVYLPSDRLLTVHECLNILHVIVKNPNAMVVVTGVGIFLIVKKLKELKEKEEALNFLLKNASNTAGQDTKLSEAIKSYMNKHGNF